jgi:hypothetical protein
MIESHKFTKLKGVRNNTELAIANKRIFITFFISVIEKTAK